MDKNFSLYGDPRYLFEPTQDELANNTLTEEGNQIITLRKTIANKMARDNNMPEIP